MTVVHSVDPAGVVRKDITFFKQASILVCDMCNRVILIFLHWR